MLKDTENERSPKQSDFDNIKNLEEKDIYYFKGYIRDIQW